MLKISQAQLDAMDAQGFDSFEDRCLAFLEDEFPERFVYAGPDRMRHAVRSGMQRALLLDLTAERDILKYLYLQQLFGVDVDTNPERPWLCEILNNQELEPSSRVDRALDATAEHLDGRRPSGGWS